MDNLSEAGFDEACASFQPWLQKSPDELAKQAIIHGLLRKKAGATFGSDCYVSPVSRVLTQRLTLGDRSWIAGGAIVRGYVDIGSDCSVNPYAHIAGNVRIGNNCRIASMASIYGFNHGIGRIDIPIKDQRLVSRGVRLHEDVWVGANAVILDGVELGSHCVVAAGSVVTTSFSAYQIIGGNPAKILRDRREGVQTEPAVPDKCVRRLIFSEDPYAGFDVVLPLDLQGWDSENPLFDKVIAEVKPSLIVEVGTWKGASAIHMAKICCRLRLDAEIVCVDTWLGNWQHWARTNGVGSRDDLRLKNGFPSLYQQFLTNVIIEKMDAVITPLPLTSMAAVKLLTHYGLKPDIVYIDGDHEYEAAISDLRGWLPQLSEGGVLIGDDYMFPGVQQAVTELAAEPRWEAELMGNKFLFRRKK
jgi:acetyltransferase-like isoleucine patch superfamily enzyme